MGMTPEARVKKSVVATLKYFGAYYFFPATGGYGRSGVPDVIACYNGWFIGIECKAGDNEPTALQQRELKRIGQAGGISLILNENNIDTLHDILCEMSASDCTLVAKEIGN